jgi:hypothetical protein
MRVSIYAEAKDVKVRNLGSKDGRFIDIQIDDVSISFYGYGLENVAAIRKLAEGLQEATEQMIEFLQTDEDEAKHDVEMQRLIEPDTDEQTGHEQHDTLEEARGDW